MKRNSSEATFPGTAQGPLSHGTSLYTAARRVLLFLIADILYNVAYFSTPDRNLQHNHLTYSKVSLHNSRNPSGVIAFTQE